MAKSVEKGSLRERIEALHNDLKSRLKARQHLGQGDADAQEITRTLDDLTKLTKIAADMQADMQNLAKRLAEAEAVRGQVERITRLVSDL